MVLYRHSQSAFLFYLLNFSWKIFLW